MFHIPQIVRPLMPKRVPSCLEPRRPSVRLRRLQQHRPRSGEELGRFVEACFGLQVPRLEREQGVGGPLAYLSDAFFDRPGDAVVWANRGGGKTMLGAAATLLDLIFKPGIEVRLLGGSLQQAERMYAHLRTLLDRPVLRKGGGVLATEPTQRRIVLQNGSRVELLACSQRSVRGTRVQVLRCDEVEEMDREVWSAAQMVTRSVVIGGEVVPGRVEALSTMHRPVGLMAELTRSGSRRLYKWNALDVAARCPADLPCDGCVLWKDCRGRAKQADGFVPIEDLMQQRRRVSDRVWDAEMMCQRPTTLQGVYPSFDLDQHVNNEEPWRGNEGGRWFGGMDFGLRCPTVLLWAWSSAPGMDQPLYIAGEYIASGRTVEANLVSCDELAEAHGLPLTNALSRLAVDPAGHQRSGQTGVSDVQVLRRLGCHVVAPRAPLRLGIEAVRRRLDQGLLRIHPRCKGLIESIGAYRYDAQHPQSEQPMKDGPDHACDALRYLVLAFDRKDSGLKTRGY